MSDNKYSADEILKELNSATKKDNNINRSQATRNYYANTTTTNLEKNKRYVDLTNKTYSNNTGQNRNTGYIGNSNRTSTNYSKMQQDAQTYYNDKSVPPDLIRNARISLNSRQNISGNDSIQDRRFQNNDVFTTQNYQNNTYRINNGQIRGVNINENDNFDRINPSNPKYQSIDEFLSNRQNYGELDAQFAEEERQKELANLSRVRRASKNQENSNAQKYQNVGEFLSNRQNYGELDAQFAEEERQKELANLSRMRRINKNQENPNAQKYQNVDEFLSNRQNYGELDAQFTEEEKQKEEKIISKTKKSSKQGKFFKKKKTDKEIEEELFGSSSPNAYNFSSKTGFDFQDDEDDVDEEQEDISIEDIDDTLSRTHTSLVTRVIISFISFMLIIYLSLSTFVSLPMPSFMTANKIYLLWANIALLGISTFTNASTIGNGILAFVKMKPNNDTYTSLTVFVCLIQSIYIALQQRFFEQFSSNIFLPVAAAMILFNAIGKLIFINRVENSFEVLLQNKSNNFVGIANVQELNIYLASKMSEGMPFVAYFSKAEFLNSFLDEAYSYSKTEEYSKIIAPITFSSCMLVSMIYYLITRDILAAICILTGLVCITSPMAAVISSQIPLSKCNKKLSESNTTICGYDSVTRMDYLNTVLFSSDDLFSVKNMAITDMKSLNGKAIDRAIINAIACVSSFDNNFSRMFKSFGEGLKLPIAEDAEYQNGMGYTAWINGRRILVGTRRFMSKNGIALVSINLEQSMKMSNGEAIYIADSGVAVAMVAVSYCPMKNMLKSMELLRDNGFGIVIKSTDPSLTPAKVGEIYKYPPDLITVLSGNLINSVEEVTNKQNGEATILYTNVFDAVKAIFTAKSCTKMIGLQTSIILLSVVIGFIMIGFFAFTHQIFSLSWVTVLGYQFIWLILSMILSLFKRAE